MNNQDKIDSLEERIADLKRYLPYADGPAYYQDKRKIAQLAAELRSLKNGVC